MIGGNYVWYLVIVVIIWDLQEQRGGGHFKVFIWHGNASHKRGSCNGKRSSHYVIWTIEVLCYIETLLQVLLGTVKDFIGYLFFLYYCCFTCFLSWDWQGQKFIRLTLNFSVCTVILHFFISLYMNINQRKRIMTAFLISQFGYCPLVWFFCSRKINNRMNRIQERALRIVYKD